MSVDAETPTLDPNDSRPMRLQVAGALRASIQAGEWPDGRLPSGTELAEKYGVARMTVQEAIRVLRDEGLVISQQGRGVFVRERKSTSGTKGESKIDLNEVLDDLNRLQGELENIQRKVRILANGS